MDGVGDERRREFRGPSLRGDENAMTLEARSALEHIEGRVVVLFEAHPGEPLRFPDAMAAMAASEAIGGAARNRAQGLGKTALIPATLTRSPWGTSSARVRGRTNHAGRRRARRDGPAGAGHRGWDRHDRSASAGQALARRLGWAIHAEYSLVRGDWGPGLRLACAVAAAAAGGSRREAARRVHRGGRADRHARTGAAGADREGC